MSTGWGIDTFRGNGRFLLLAQTEPTKGFKMEGKKLLDSLSRIEDGDFGRLFSYLPTIASGEHWRNEVIYCAGRVKDYLTEGGDYLEETLLSTDSEYADSQVETYYSQIHEANHNLGLWASPELDEAVEDCGFAPSTVMTDLEKAYYYVASAIIWQAVVREAFKFFRRVEE